MRLSIIASLIAIATSVATADEFYCQNTFYGTLLRAFSSLDEEIADDIPAAHDGRQISEVKVWMMEWGASWIDPDGIRIRFYNSACPPALDHDLEFIVDWSLISKVLVDPPVLAWGGYELTIPLPAPVTIQSPQSIGVSVVNSWGNGAPWAGFYTTPPVTGCEHYFGPGWAPASEYPGSPADLAFCLTESEIATSVPTRTVRDMQSTWSEVKQLFR